VIGIVQGALSNLDNHGRRILGRRQRNNVNSDQRRRLGDFCAMALRRTRRLECSPDEHSALTQTSGLDCRLPRRRTSKRALARHVRWARARVEKGRARKILPKRTGGRAVQTRLLEA